MNKSSKLNSVTQANAPFLTLNTNRIKYLFIPR